MQRLSVETVRLISSAQVITSISSVVKELVENSLDAHADNIEVKLENFGVDKVEVRDNGDGIRPCDAEFMGQRHFTSKLRDQADLDSLTTYGFRGEALGSLCAVSKVAIATKTREEEVGRCSTLNQEGMITTSKPSQCGTGTTVTATRLFHNVPVRKQYYSSAKQRREELKKVEDLLLSFGIVCPSVRFSLSHNRCPVWQKSKAAGLRMALLNTLGSGVMGQLQQVEISDPETQVHIEGFLPKMGSDLQLTTRSADDRTWTSVNGRPVIMKDISKVVKQYFCQAHPKAVNVRHVVMCLTLAMPTHLVDVNLEPNKTKVLLQNKDAVLSLVIRLLEEHYKTSLTSDKHPPNQSDDRLTEKAACDRVPLTVLGDEAGNKCNRPQEDKAGSNCYAGKKAHLEHSKLDHGAAMRDSRDSRENHTDNVTVPGQGEETSPQDLVRSSQPSFSLFDSQEDILALYPSLSDTFGAQSTTEWRTLEGGRHVVKDQIKRGAADVVPEKETQDVVEWSKGHALNDHRGQTVEPAVVLVPGKQHSIRGDSSGRNTPPSLTASRVSFDTPDATSSASFESSRSAEGSIPPGADTGSCLDSPQSASGSPALDAPAKQSPGKKQRLSLEKSSPGSQYDLVGKSPVRKPLDAFHFFIKEAKPDVMRQHPNLDFAAINKILKECWERLGDDERRQYKELQAKDLQRYRDQVKAAKLSTTAKDSCANLPAKKKKKTDKLSNQSLINKLLSTRPQPNDGTEPAAAATPEVTVPFSVRMLRTSSGSTDRCRMKDDRLGLIGMLSGHGIWLAVRGTRLMVFNQYRAQEVLLYHRLLANHRLPRQKLPVPIVLSSSMFGGADNWYTLLGLRSQPSPRTMSRHYTDDRLLLNGFEIRQLTDPETKDATLEIISMATDIIPFYGLDDLKEIVETIATHGAQRVKECRPLKLVNYLMGEAVRMARSLPAVMTEEEVLDIADGVAGLTPWTGRLCLHGKSFEREIFTIPDVNGS